eukprot:1733145-Pleurochrysis_carterae.AAC.1
MEGARTSSSDTARGGTGARGATEARKGGRRHGLLRVKAGREGWARTFETCVTGHAAKQND